MKIDAVLARHPWPWHVSEHPYDEWSVYDSKGKCVFDDGSDSEDIGPQFAADVRDAILELVEAHVASKASKAGGHRG